MKASRPGARTSSSMDELVTLPPGAYTAILSGVNNTSGVAVIGVFATQ